MNIEKYLYDLLKKHECVIMPGFGAFITHRQSALHIPSEHKFLAPSKSISFNRLLQTNDGLLIQFIAAQMSISYLEAQQKLQRMIVEWNELLEKNQTLSIKNIGKIYMQLDGKIQFVPDLADNIEIQSYGLRSTKHIPINRLEDKLLRAKVTSDAAVTIKKSTNRKLELKRKNRGRRRAYALSIAACLVLAIACIQFFFFVDAPIKMNEANFISFVSSTNSELQIQHGSVIHESSLVLPEAVEYKKAIVLESATINPKPAEKVKLVVSKEPMVANNPYKNQTGYYIVLGCFQEQKNADNLYNAIVSKGKLPYKKGNANGTTLVAEFASSNQEEAQQMLQAKRSTQSDVWLKYIRY